MNSVINPDGERIISSRIYTNYVTLLFMVLFFLGILSNYFTDLEPSMWVSFSLFLLSIVFLILNRYSKNHFLITAIGFVFLLVTYNLYFIYNFGPQGPMVYSSFLLVCLILYYSQKEISVILYSILIANIILLEYAAFQLPNFTANYTDMQILIIDHIISLLLIFIPFIVFFKTLISIHTREKIIALESTKLKTSFLTNTSHDLRAPVNSILSFSDLIRNEELSKEELNRYTNIISSNSHQLLTLVNDIFDISIIESKNINIHPQYVNINEILEDVYDNFKRDIEVNERNIELRVHFGLPFTQSIIYIDPVRIKQILTNLIQNAIKHTPEGAIIFGYDKDMNKDELVFFVKDTGYGIPDDQLENIFTRYVTNIDASKKIKGTGLGLHITSSLVALMKGKIWVKSVIDKGSMFYFSIPIEISNSDSSSHKN